MIDYNTSMRAVCPHCNGHKTEMVMTEVMTPERFVRSHQKCHVCNGEGIVNKTVTYTPLV